MMKQLLDRALSRVINPAIRERINGNRLYDIDLFNFEHAVKCIGADPAMQEYKTDLVKRSVASRIEKQKNQLILDALQAQRAALPWWRRWAA